MTSKSQFKLTYATMFNPPEELHERFNESLAVLKSNLGQEHPMIINGKDCFADEKFEDRSPIDTDMVLGVFQKGSVNDAQDALMAARDAFPKWRSMKWQERVALIRKAASLIDERIFDIGAILALEVGKSRLEALGDVAEAADLIRYPCSAMEANQGFVIPMDSDPLIGYKSQNTSVLLPYGVWVVISPFNFPTALTSGPLGTTLVAGNTVVIKPASDTPWSVLKIAECLRDAGIPDGVCNFVTGPGGTLGQALIESPQVDGITFTGSKDVGMGIFRSFAAGEYARPIVLELGGKNPAIVSKHADLETAALGIVRSAFGLQGQKCSACSRVFVEKPLSEALIKRLVELTNKLSIGDPTERDIFLGPVMNKSAYDDYQKYIDDLRKHGTILTGGAVLKDGIFSKGYFCAPTLVTDIPEDHYLWKHEMFLPITMIASVDNLEDAMRRANDVPYGLTAGFYGTEEEAGWFNDNIEVGVTYVNRPQGATAGAWPGYQSFGGWKGSGYSGKNAFGPHYIQLYMHEQSRTVIKPD